MATAVAAVLGIVVSAALAWAASQLAGQRVGLSSEPFSVATGLAPRVRSTPAPTSAKRGDDNPGAARRQRPAVSGAAAPQSPATSTSAPQPSYTVSTASPSAPSASATAAATPPHTRTAGDGGPSVPASPGTAQGRGHHGDGGDQRDD